MNRLLRRLIAVFCLVASGFSAYGRGYRDNSFQYRIDTDLGIATVVKVLRPAISELGYLEIPAEVVYREVSYPVTGIALDATFSRVSESVKQLRLPHTIASIDVADFESCGNLEEWIVDENNPNLSAVDGALCDKSGIALYHWPEKKTPALPEGITAIGRCAFYGHEGLTEIALPESITLIADSAFYGSGLTKLVLPARVDSIGDYAFPELKYLHLTGDAAPRVGAISGYPRLFIKRGTKEAYQEIEWFSREILVEVTNVVQTGNFLFDCVEETPGVYEATVLCHLSEEELQVLDIPAMVSVSGNEYTVRKIGDGAFSSSSELIKVDLSATSIREIGEKAFYACLSLSDIKFPTTLEVIGIRAFCDNLSLRTVEFPESLVSLGAGAFLGCPLEAVVLPESLKYVGGSAFGAIAAEKPCSVQIPAGVEYIGGNAFGGMFVEVAESNAAYTSEKGVLYDKEKTRLVSVPRNLATMEVPATVVEIDAMAFAGCRLEEISFPGSVRRIGFGAFSGCDLLKKISIPEGVAELENDLFNGCRLLEEVELPASLLSMGYDVFCQTPSLRVIYSRNPVPPVAVADDYMPGKSGTFSFFTYVPEGGFPQQESFPFQDCKVYVPKGSKAAYAQAAGWEHFVFAGHPSFSFDNIEEYDDTGIDGVACGSLIIYNVESGICVSTEKAMQIEIYTMEGMPVGSAALAAGKTEIPLTSGNYLLRTDAGNVLKIAVR